MKNLVVLSGAGISAESGLQTFRASDGLWNNHSIYDVATPDAWRKNPQLVLEFYNHRRSELANVKPNKAHHALAALDDHYHTTIITQNVDDLHERGGSQNILHLHGQLTQARGEFSENTVFDISYSPIHIGDKISNGEQVRPHIVWFGEDVPLIEDAAEICQTADILIVVGTSLQVYPAAGLMHQTPAHCAVYVVDPHVDELNIPPNVTAIKASACEAIPALVEKLITTT